MVSPKFVFLSEFSSPHLKTVKDEFTARPAALRAMSDSSKDELRHARDKRWCALMRAAQDGDSVAYTLLLSELLPVLRRAVQKKWRSPQDVEDIVQDILLSLHSVRQTYDPRRPFMPWLMTIASRRIADAARKVSARSANETTVDVMPETFADHETKKEQEVVDDRDAVRWAIATLPAGQREAIELLKLKGLSLQEASAATGKSVAALKVTVHRAVKAMRENLRHKPHSDQ
jgi:RNA polymerase sigma-70 factor (ECF subfamily)